MNILLTSVGRRTYMVEYFKQAVLNHGLVHAANSTETYSMKVADKSVITPLIYDDNYINFLLDYCKTNNINVVISLFDIDLPILAKSKNKFIDNNIVLIVSDLDIITTCNDKWLTYNFLKKYNFSVPHTFINIIDTLHAIKEGLINYPLIIKPRWGMGSIGIFQADNELELNILFSKTKNCITNSYLKYESFQDIENSILIQEKLDGEEYGLDILNNLKGEFIACVPKKKIAMRAGETDIAEIVNTKELLDLGKNLGNITKHIGNLDIDCFFTNGKYYILEMNCRFGGQYPFSHLAGANFPKILIDLIHEKPVNYKFLDIQFGTIGCKDLIPLKIN